MSEELKPCPFCGSPAELIKKYVACSSTQCNAYETHIPIDEWNTRPIEDALRATPPSFVEAFTAQMVEIHQTNTGNGFATDDLSFLKKLAEEAGEVADAITDLTGEYPNLETARMNLTVELADVVIAVMFYAAGNGLPLAEAIEAKNLHNKTRGWKHGKVSA